LTKAIKLDSKNNQTLPCMVQIETKDEIENENGESSRPNVDLICVIDTSGSMMGQKIKLV